MARKKTTPAPVAPKTTAERIAELETLIAHNDVDLLVQRCWVEAAQRDYATARAEVIEVMSAPRRPMGSPSQRLGDWHMRTLVRVEECLVRWERVLHMTNPEHRGEDVLTLRDALTAIVKETELALLSGAMVPTSTCMFTNATVLARADGARLFLEQSRGALAVYRGRDQQLEELATLKAEAAQ